MKAYLTNTNISLPKSSSPKRGTFIADEWREIIVTKNGSADRNGVELLGEIYYWLSPVQGQEHTTRCGSDMWLTSYSYLKKKLNITHETLRRTFVKLTELGLIERIVGTIVLKGQAYNNRLFIKPNLNNPLLRDLRTSRFKPSQTLNSQVSDQVTEVTDAPKETYPQALNISVEPAAIELGDALDQDFPNVTPKITPHSAPHSIAEPVESVFFDPNPVGAFPQNVGPRYQNSEAIDLDTIDTSLYVDESCQKSTLATSSVLSHIEKKERKKERNQDKTEKTAHTKKTNQESSEKNVEKLDQATKNTRKTSAKAKESKKEASIKACDLPPLSEKNAIRLRKISGRNFSCSFMNELLQKLKAKKSDIVFPNFYVFLNNYFPKFLQYEKQEETCKGSEQNGKQEATYTPKYAPKAPSKFLSEMEEIKHEEVVTLQLKSNRQFSLSFMNQLLQKMKHLKPKHKFSNREHFLNYFGNLLKHELRDAAKVSATNFRLKCNIKNTYYQEYQAALHAEQAPEKVTQKTSEQGRKQGAKQAAKADETSEETLAKQKLVQQQLAELKFDISESICPIKIEKYLSQMEANASAPGFEAHFKRKIAASLNPRAAYRVLYNLIDIKRYNHSEELPQDNHALSDITKLTLVIVKEFPIADSQKQLILNEARAIYGNQIETVEMITKYMLHLRSLNESKQKNQENPMGIQKEVMGLNLKLKMVI